MTVFFINPFLEAAGGDFESIATVTVGSGGASSIEFTSIPGTYQHLQIRIVARSTAAASGLQSMYLNLGTGSVDSGSNYAWHALYGTGASASTWGFASQTGGVAGWVQTDGEPANAYGAIVLDILDYSNTSKNTTVRSFSGYDSNGSGRVALLSSLWASTGAVQNISLSALSPDKWKQHSTAALYGIKAP